MWPVWDQAVRLRPDVIACRRSVRRSFRRSCNLTLNTIRFAISLEEVYRAVATATSLMLEPISTGKRERRTTYNRASL